MYPAMTDGEFVTTISALLGVQGFGMKVGELPTSHKYRLNGAATHLIYKDGLGQRKTQKIEPTHAGGRRVGKIQARQLVRTRLKEVAVIGDQRPDKYLNAHARRARFEADGLNDSERAKIVREYRKATEAA